MNNNNKKKKTHMACLAEVYPYMKQPIQYTKKHVIEKVSELLWNGGTSTITLKNHPGEQDYVTVTFKFDRYQSDQVYEMIHDQKSSQFIQGHQNKEQTKQRLEELIENPLFYSMFWMHVGKNHEFEQISKFTLKGIPCSYF